MRRSTLSLLACALCACSAAENPGPGDKDGGAPASSDATVNAPDDASSNNGNDASNTNPGDAAVPPPASRGASLPYWEYEAEDAMTNGMVIGPSRTFGDPAAEASGRRAVQLNNTGQYVQFTTEHPTNSIVVRYSIPDAPSGGGSNSTLGLYINGTRKASLALTSRYSWTYGDADAQGTGADVPGNGTAHHFYDEAHLMFGDVPPGSTISLQRDSQDNAAYYVIDFVDFEEVGPPLARPAGSISIDDFGAVADDNNDDGPAIQKAIDSAQAQNKIVWIPQGTYESTTVPFNVSGVTIRGAGMWYSVLHGFWAQFKVSGDNNQFYDFAISGDVTSRDDQKGYNGFDGPAGTGSRLEGVWIEHEKVGWWVGKGAYVGVPTQALTDGLVVHGVRVRDTYADGINFANGTKNSIVEQSNLRNTGDDALATWSYTQDGPPCENNVFRFNTVQLVWRATCLAIYGGKDHKIQDNLCADTSNYPGIFLSTTAGFQPWPFTGTTLVERNTLTRAGGPHYGYSHGAFKVFSDFNAVTGVQVSDLDIEDSTFMGIHFEGTQAVSNISFANVQINGYGMMGIWVTSNAHGTVQADNVVVTGPLDKGLQNDDPSGFTFTRGNGDSGW
jgi:hypothetical protein